MDNYAELKREVEELKAKWASLERSSDIPSGIDQSFRARFLQGLTPILVSSKSATSENEAIDEGGATTHTVMKKPDGFLQVDLGGGTIYYIPIFT